MWSIIWMILSATGIGTCWRLLRRTCLWMRRTSLPLTASTAARMLTSSLQVRWCCLLNTRHWRKLTHRFITWRSSRWWASTSYIVLPTTWVTIQALCWPTGWTTRKIGIHGTQRRVMTAIIMRKHMKRTKRVVQVSKTDLLIAWRPAVRVVSSDSVNIR